MLARTRRTSGSPTRRCLAFSTAIASAWGRRAKRRPGTRPRPRVVVHAQDQGHQQFTGHGPAVQVGISGAAQTTGDEDGAVDAIRAHAGPSAGPVRCRTTSRPASGQAIQRRPRTRRQRPRRAALLHHHQKRSLAGALRGGGAAGIEPQHRPARPGQAAPAAAFFEQMAVHHAALSSAAITGRFSVATRSAFAGRAAAPSPLGSVRQWAQDDPHAAGWRRGPPNFGARRGTARRGGREWQDTRVVGEAGGRRGGRVEAGMPPHRCCASGGARQCPPDPVGGPQATRCGGCRAPSLIAAGAPVGLAPSPAPGSGAQTPQSPSGQDLSTLRPRAQALKEGPRSAARRIRSRLTFPSLM